MKLFPHEQTAPQVDVDTFWHYHILDTMKYAADCDAVFGYFLHHFPYIGLRGEDQEATHVRVGARMGELYQATFGEDYARAAAGMQALANAQPGRSAFSRAAPLNAGLSGAATMNAAFCGAVKARTAFSGAATLKPTFSGMPPATAFSRAQTGTSQPHVGMYTVRPTLASKIAEQKAG